MKRVLLVLWLFGCNDDYLLPSGGGGDDTDLPAGDGWCAVQSIFRSDCFNCHDASALGGLDLETDPYAALVNHAAAGDAAAVLVVPGDPDASALYQKLIDTQTFGGSMPPGGLLGAAATEVVRAWIADGASDVCEGPIDTTDTDGGASYHPDGFADPIAHGVEAKLQIQECVDCHGADLTGTGPAISCDTCHAPGWRTDCTFCHGDPAEGTGAPPVHISGADDGANASFIPHLVHTQVTDLKRALDCAECHTTPTDVLSPGHLFIADDTPAVAEVVFSAGLSDAARWNGNGQCTNLYCHGTGRGDNGTVAHTRQELACNDCHPDPTSTENAWETMSGDHDEHLKDGIQCWECHGDTTNNAMVITGIPLHVNGVANVALRPGMSRVGNECTGSCHGENHNSRNW